METEAIVALATMVTAIVGGIVRYFEKRSMERQHKRELEEASEATWKPDED